MREEDKVLLLCEIMGLNTKPYVSKYVEELRSSDVFLKLCENVIKARKNKSYKAQRLIDEFELINFESVHSLQEFYCLSAKINYLLANSDAVDYINPFFYNDDNIDSVGQIAIDFDAQRFSLDDISLDERYTLNYKIDYIKNAYSSWRQEVKEMVVNPIKDAAINIDKFPQNVLFDFEYVTYLCLVLLSNIVLSIGPIINSEYLKPLYDGTCDNIVLMVLFYVICIMLFILNIYFIVSINGRLKRTRRYRVARNMLANSDKIISEIDFKCQSFYEYVMNSLTETKPLTKKLKMFALNSKYLLALHYLINRFNRDEIEKEEDIEINSAIKALLIIFVVIIITFIILLFVSIGGNV